MAKLLSDYMDTVELFLNMSYEEKVSVCRESFLTLLHSFPDDELHNVATILIQMMGAIYESDSCAYPIEKQFIKDVLKLSMITDEYLARHWSNYGVNRYNKIIGDALSMLSKDAKREFVTIAIGMATVDGKENYKEKARIKEFFDFYEVFDEVFDPYAWNY